MINMTNWYMKEHGVPDSKWHVLEYVGKSKWKCECECGTIKEVEGNSLRRGGSKSCGCARGRDKRFIDMTGWKMWEHGVPNSKIIVLKELPNEGGHPLWECKCNCGNPKTFKVDGANLRSGHTTSCGCSREGINHKNRTGLVFNDITFGEVVGKDKQGNYLYDCTCLCGNHFISNAARILNYHVQSCGCLTSKGEQKIQQLLEELNIDFVREYPLKEVLSEKGKPRRMDFAIYKNNQLFCFIEYQGEQHTEPSNNWYRPYADIEKRDYCNKKGIPLIEISYMDYNLLDADYLLNRIKLTNN